MNQLRRIQLVLIAIVCLCSGLIVACGQPESLPSPSPAEPQVPSHYATYIDEARLYSISYPPDWEPAFSIIEELETTVKDIVAGTDDDATLEQAHIIFFAGIPAQDGYEPCVNIVVALIPEGEFAHDRIVELQIRGIRDLVQDYRELSRVKTTISGIEATIVEGEGTIPEVGKFHNMQMYMNAGDITWCVSCEPPAGEFSKWEEDFNNIVRSFRILKP